MPERVTYAVVKSALVPMGNEARAVHDRLKLGTQVHVEIFQIRDQKFSNQVNTVIDRIAKAKGMRIKHVRGWLAIETGRADLVAINGKVVPVAWPTGPRDMNADEFEAFWADAREMIFNKILPTLTPEDAADINSMIESMRI